MTYSSIVWIHSRPFTPNMSDSVKSCSQTGTNSCPTCQSTSGIVRQIFQVTKALLWHRFEWHYKHWSMIRMHPPQIPTTIKCSGDREVVVPFSIMEAQLKVFPETPLTSPQYVVARAPQLTPIMPIISRTAGKKPIPAHVGPIEVRNFWHRACYPRNTRGKRSQGIVKSSSCRQHLTEECQLEMHQCSINICKSIYKNNII